MHYLHYAAIIKYEDYCFSSLMAEMTFAEPQHVICTNLLLHTCLFWLFHATTFFCFHDLVIFLCSLAKVSAGDLCWFHSFSLSILHQSLVFPQAMYRQTTEDHTTEHVDLSFVSLSLPLLRVNCSSKKQKTSKIKIIFSFYLFLLLKSAHTFLSLSYLVQSPGFLFPPQVTALLDQLFPLFAPPLFCFSLSQMLPVLEIAYLYL